MEQQSLTYRKIAQYWAKYTQHFMQPSMGILNSPTSRFAKDSTPSTSNLEVYKFRDWWILTYFIFALGESSPNNIWSTVNLERTCVLLFYCFLCLKVNLDLEKTNQLGESSLNFIFAVVNLDPFFWKRGELMVNPDLTILLKRWIEVKIWGG